MADMDEIRGEYAAMRQAHREMAAPAEEWSLGGLSPETDLALCRWSVLHGINEIKRHTT